VLFVSVQRSISKPWARPVRRFRRTGLIP